MTNREIKFRGKRKDNGEWVEGYYLPMASGAKHYIYLPLEYLNEHSRVEIDPATLGQDTGLKDNNGKEIYEGDILKVYDPESRIWSKDGGKVVFSHGYVGGWVISVPNGFLNIGSRQNQVEIIGNITDNPELLLTNK